MFYRLGAFACRRRFLVVGAWFACLLLSAPFIPRLTGVLAVGGFSNPDLESARARETLEQGVPGYTSSILVVIFQSPDLDAHDAEFGRRADATLAGIATLPEVLEVVRFQDNLRQISADGHTAYSLVRLSLPPEQSQRLMPEIRTRLVNAGLETTLAGPPAFYEDVERISEGDLRRAEAIAIPIALVALVLVFGTVVGALVPLVVGGMSVAVVLGLVYVVAGRVDMSIFVLNLASMLGLGLAIDYSLFMTSRFREELRRRDVAEAVAVTSATAGRAVFFSGLTVVIGLAGLTLFNFMFLRSVGIAGALVVTVAVAGALTLLPAVLAIVGSRIERGAVSRRPASDAGRFWVGLSNTVMAHPWFVFVPVIVFLVALGLPFFNANLSSPDATILPTRVDSRRGFEVLRSEFGDGEISPIVIALTSTTSSTSPENLAALWDFTRYLAADERVMRVDSLVSVDPRLSLAQYQLVYARPDDISDPIMRREYQQLAGPNTTLVLVYPRELAGSDEAKNLLADIRAHPAGGDYRMLVDGGTAEIVDVVNEMYSEFPRVAAIIVAATYIVLLFLFRSIVLPLKAIVMNTLSIVASYGALVYIFQEGHFSNLLGFTRMGFVEASLPILMFCILFGLSMDYEVFLLTRVRETWLETHDNRASVATGLQRSGRIITGAALIVVVVTFSFVTAEIVLVKALGLGIAIAVLLDATVVRALLVPATMRLLGSVNWWFPERLSRLIPRGEFEH
jgi:putative drug exporter of the RND superfamily